MGRLLLTLVLALACWTSSTGFYTRDSGQFADEEDFGELEQGSGDYDASISFFSSMLEFPEDSDTDYPPTHKCIRCTSVHIGGCDVNNLRQKDDIIQECPGQCLNISSGDYFAYDCAKSLVAPTGCTENAGMTMCLCTGHLCNAPLGLLPFLPGDNDTAGGNSTDGNRTTYGDTEEDYTDAYTDEYTGDYDGWTEVEGGEEEGTPVLDLDVDTGEDLVVLEGAAGDTEGDSTGADQGENVFLDLQLPKGHSAAPPTPQSTMLARALNSRSGASHVTFLTPHLLWLSLLCVHSAVS